MHTAGIFLSGARTPVRARPPARWDLTTSPLCGHLFPGHVSSLAQTQKGELTFHTLAWAEPFVKLVVPRVVKPSVRRRRRRGRPSRCPAAGPSEGHPAALLRLVSISKQGSKASNTLRFARFRRFVLRKNTSRSICTTRKIRRDKNGTSTATSVPLQLYCGCTSVQRAHMTCGGGLMSCSVDLDARQDLGAAAEAFRGEA